MPFFSSLTHTGTRTGGQLERQCQAFEAGTAQYPHDFPGTDACAELAEHHADQQRAAWLRRPPAKRPNFDKLGTRSPWRPDWGVVLGLEEPREADDLEDFLDTQRRPVEPAGLPPGQAATETGPSEDKQWLLRGPDVPALVSTITTMLNPAAGLLVHVNQMRAKRRLDPLGGGVRTEALLKGALVQVSLTLCGRGRPKDFAVIYCMGDSETQMWIGAEARRKNRVTLGTEEPDETEVR